MSELSRRLELTEPLVLLVAACAAQCVPCQRRGVVVSLSEGHGHERVVSSLALVMVGMLVRLTGWIGQSAGSQLWSVRSGRASDADLLSSGIAIRVAFGIRIS